jgi:glyoxylase-like metal-dependent hydrolase (beta-lactamase superfamily II)
MTTVFPNRREALAKTQAWIVVPFLLFLYAGGPGLAGASCSSDGPLPPLAPFTVQITDGLHILGGLSPSAAYAVETTRGIVLVDSGLRSDARVLKSQMAGAGLDWRRVRAVLLTHAHADHTGGAQCVRSETGATVYAGEGDAAVLRAGGPREALFSAFELPEGTMHATNVDVALKGGETIDFGDVRFRVLATPGHTPGSICYLMARGTLRALFTGDVISTFLGAEKSRARIARPLGTYSTYMPPRYRGDAEAYLASLRKLRALPLPDLVLPGHPRSDPTPQEPRLSQARWEKLLDDGIAEMARLSARYDADGADFLDGNAKELMPGLYYLGDFQGAAVYGLFAASKLFLIDAPGGPGLLAFVKARLQKLGLPPQDPAAVLLTSCDASSTAGLAALVGQCHATVVVAPEGRAKIRELCPPGAAVLSSNELPQQQWFDVTPVKLRGRGVAPVAYRFKWRGKTVLCTGRFPIDPDVPSEAALLSEISVSRETTLDYLASVFRLSETNPDLWLPALPLNGQNANLYDNEWQNIVADNYRVGYSSLMGRVR